jgi:hypothetical protein
MGIGSVSIFQYDACSDTVLLQAVGETDTLGADELQVSRQLDWASLDTTITLTNIDTPLRSSPRSGWSSTGLK